MKLIAVDALSCRFVDGHSKENETSLVRPCKHHYLAIDAQIVDVVEM